MSNVVDDVEVCCVRCTRNSTLRNIYSNRKMAQSGSVLVKIKHFQSIDPTTTIRKVSLCFTYWLSMDWNTVVTDIHPCNAVLWRSSDHHQKQRFLDSRCHPPGTKCNNESAEQRENQIPSGYSLKFTLGRCFFSQLTDSYLGKRPSNV